MAAARSKSHLQLLYCIVIRLDSCLHIWNYWPSNIPTFLFFLFFGGNMENGQMIIPWGAVFGLRSGDGPFQEDDTGDRCLRLDF
jgi:uncharacterized membrane protein YedE/YeeE